MRVQAGDHVNANVRLVEELGAGGMGSVWIAEHLTLKNRVAVKFIHYEGKEDRLASAVKRFSREAALAAQIQHPHVVQMFDHGVTDAGLPYIVMELLEGESLKARLDRGALTPEQVRTLLTQISKVLERAHKSEIIHRDLKPANLFLVDSGYDVFVKVLDFGIAKQTSSEEMELTESSALVGTPLFMSKEALRGREKLDHRADLWSLGVVVYHALTRRYPFRGETFAEQVLMVHEGHFEPPSAVMAGASDELDAWFEKCFATDIDERFQSAGEMAAAFVDALKTLPDDAGAVISQDAIIGDTSDSAIAAMSTVTARRATKNTALGLDAKTADEAALSTLTGASSNTGSSSKRRPMWLVALAVAGVAGAGWFASTRSGDSVAAAPVDANTSQRTGSSSATAAEPGLSATPSPAPPPKTMTTGEATPTSKVALSLDAPAGATFWVGGKQAGQAPEALALERGTEAVEIEVRAPGYVTKTISVTPDIDKTVPVDLARPTRPHKPAMQPKPSDGLKW